MRTTTPMIEKRHPHSYANTFIYLSDTRMRPANRYSGEQTLYSRRSGVVDGGEDEQAGLRTHSASSKHHDAVCI